MERPLERVTHALAPQRQAQLLEQLRSRAYVGVQHLCELLGVSEATIRRDLADLESRGLLRRTHGGALSINQVTSDFTNAEREVLRQEEKARIAKAAAGLVVDGDAIFIDAGTTALQVARQLCQRESLTFVTNGADAFSCLSAVGARRLFVIGGEYLEITHGFGGPLAAEAIRRFNVDKVILSVSAIDMARGQICISSPMLAAAQQAMIEIAQTVIVVADHSKFGRGALTVVSSLDVVDYIVTNSEARGEIGVVPEKLKHKMIFA